MLVFIIPLQSQASAQSWAKVGLLFERCLKSVCAQTSDRFRVIVVCNDLPAISFEHPHVEYVCVNYPLPLHERGRSAAETKLIIGHTDKGRKILRGLVEAQKHAPTHTMVVDADDCVSHRLAAFVAQHPTRNGWVVDRGYRYPEGNTQIYFKRRKFHEMCGTCNILRYDLNYLPQQPEYDRGYGYYTYYIDHEKVRGVLANYGTPLKRLPFVGAVYVVGTGENLYYDERRLSQSFLTRFNYRRLTPRVRAEFGLYPLKVGRVLDPMLIGPTGPRRV
ncbi:MAG: glycosyltransferase family 2 protein [Synechococcales cyanobacterium CRU_2_2]|nr:glycosyltransferase family 2 protein [Synechococcales cyanobacterium CRU_2_2]